VCRGILEDRKSFSETGLLSGLQVSKVFQPCINVGNKCSRTKWIPEEDEIYNLLSERRVVRHSELKWAVARSTNIRTF
jgi:hypothetical protein